MKKSKTEANGITTAAGDYLKAIYDLEVTEGRASTGALAERLGIAPASVTNMLCALASRGLVDYQKRKGATLTPRGLQLAKQLMRHYETLEFILLRLGASPEEAQTEAERLEHEMSVETAQRLAAAIAMNVRSS